MNAIVKIDPSNGAAHSSIGPSGAHRWMKCGASVGFIKRAGIKDEEGEEACRGTVAHAVGAEAILSGREAWEYAGQIRKASPDSQWEFEVDEEMVLSVQTWIDLVRVTMKRYEHLGALLYIERRVWSDYDDEAFGTSDTVIEVPGVCIIIIDFKNGMIVIEPKDEQLKLYGQYAYERRSDAMKGKGEPLKIELVICQPRAPHPKGPIRLHTTDVDTLDMWMLGEVLPAIAVTRDPNAPFVLGDHCHYCPANQAGRCPAMKTLVAELPVAVPVDALTNEQITKYRGMKGSIKKFMEGVDKEALRRVKDEGQSIEGCKLVHKLGNRVFRNAMKVLQPDGVTETVIKLEDQIKALWGEKGWEKPKLKSPAQIEKLPGGANFASQWAFKPDTGLTLAEDDDTREPAVGLMQMADAAASSNDTIPV